MAAAVQEFGSFVATMTHHEENIFE